MLLRSKRNMMLQRFKIQLDGLSWLRGKKHTKEEAGYHKFVFECQQGVNFSHRRRFACKITHILDKLYWFISHGSFWTEIKNWDFFRFSEDRLWKWTYLNSVAPTKSWASQKKIFVLSPPAGGMMHDLNPLVPPLLSFALYISLAKLHIKKHCVLPKSLQIFPKKIPNPVVCKFESKLRCKLFAQFSVMRIPERKIGTFLHIFEQCEFRASPPAGIKHTSKKIFGIFIHLHLHIATPQVSTRLRIDSDLRRIIIRGFTKFSSNRDGGYERCGCVLFCGVTQYSAEANGNIPKSSSVFTLARFTLQIIVSHWFDRIANCKKIRYRRVILWTTWNENG